MKTYFPKELTHDWVLVDATGQTVGRLATQIASVLKGKHKPTYTPSQPGGDFVIVINAEKVQFSGNKLDQKVYTRYTGYPGGLRITPLARLIDHAHQLVVGLDELLHAFVFQLPADAAKIDAEVAELAQPAPDCPAIRRRQLSSTPQASACPIAPWARSPREGLT